MKVIDVQVQGIKHTHMEAARFRSVATEDHASVQIASARGLEMAMPQIQDAGITAEQLMMRGNMLTPYNVLGRLPTGAYGAVPEKQVENLVADLLDSLERPTVKRPRYHIVHLASEMAPVAKVGGLGDVVTGLGKSLQKRGHRVEVILPKYKCMDVSVVKNLKKLNKQFYSYYDGAMHKNIVWTGVVEGLWVYFIDTLHPKNFFGRERFYSEPDDFDRFTYFSRAALEFLLQFGKRPNIIHCHDWPVAMAVPLHRSIYAGLGLDSKIAFTCHNFEHQGVGSMDSLASSGIRFKDHIKKDHFKDNLVPDKINLLKGGLLFSDFVTTVSPTYAKEVVTQEGGAGLHTTINSVSKKFHGIVNGIDEKVWNPATDPHLEFHFSEDNLTNKQLIKNKLRQRLGLQIQENGEAERPLVCCVSRLVPQKGVHLLRQAIFHTLARGGQFVLQGTSPIPAIQEEFDDIARQFENHPHIRLVLRVEENLTHNIFGAADIFVIPSMFEPCGLTQLYSMRYGAIPVVRKTGGLADSVFDVDCEAVPLEKRNGFTFINPDEQSVSDALDRALDYYNERKQWWKELQHTVMRIDFSWDAAPVDQYIDLYERAVDKAHNATFTPIV